MSIWQIGDEPYRHYWRVLYPRFADPSTAHWLGKWKTLEMCMGLFAARQRARHALIRKGEWLKDAHSTAVVTFHASPVRAQTAKVCLSCLWITGDVDAEHPDL